MFRWRRRRRNGNQGNRDLEEAVRILEEIHGLEEVPEAPITRAEASPGGGSARSERERIEHAGPTPTIGGARWSATLMVGVLLLAGFAEEMVVVDSRAEPRSATESAVPVDVLSAADLAGQGRGDLSDHHYARIGYDWGD